MSPTPRPSRDAADELEAAATTLHRLAVLLSAGVAPHSAWTHLGASSNFARNVSRLTDNGESVGDAVLAASSGAPTWRAVAAAWLVASVSGAPLASALRSFAAALRDFAQSQRDVRVALAGPAATIRVVLFLPLVGLLLGLAL